MEIRESVMKFARLMEQRLRENDHKNGWDGMDPEWLFDSVIEEAGELRRALLVELPYPTGPNIEWVGQEAADVANFAMMIADVCGALDSETPDVD